MKNIVKSFLITLNKLRILPSWLILFFDIIIITSVGAFNYLIYKNLGVNFSKVATLNISYPVLLSSYLIYFYYFNTYKVILRYSSLRDIIKVFKAVFFATLTAILIDQICYQLYDYSIFIYSTLLNGTCLVFFALIGFRIVIKSVFQFLNQDEHTDSEKQPIAIVGVNSINISLVDPLTAPSSLYDLKCFFDPNKSLNGKKVAGITVVGGTSSIVAYLRFKKINNLILPKGYLKRSKEKKLIEECIQNKIKVFKPELLQNTNDAAPANLKEYGLEELLFRDKINIENPKVISEYENKVVLVTGAAGSIGSELAKQIAVFKPKKLIILDQGETALHDIQLYFDKHVKDCKCSFELIDVTNTNELTPIFENYKPEIIFHAAAYKHVPVLEKNYKQAIKVNVFGTLNCLELAMKYGAKKFIFVSTDKAVNPTNIMGTSKRIAEMIAQNLFHAQESSKMEIMITRFGNVLGSNGSVVHLFKEQIAHGGPITVTHPEVNRFFMTIPEACKLVIEAGAMGTGGHIYVFDMGKSIKIVDLAEKMIRLAGKIPGKDIAIEFTGLRPGEKLYEEVLTETSETMPTYHPKIVIAKEKECIFSKDEIIQELEDFHTKTRKETILLLNKLVPEYQPEKKE
ncbi:polysaccharide biosynthesis protein [Flavobacterium sp.]|jgi:FlaA1/EpsC-like NDP-sugar epimerase|uniref:polysaccharide biosynthesis protein n=1 Tax=Flavobacterium sp. TaxID=239 RepID=UPI0037BF4600